MFVVEVGLADNVIITGRMYEVCNVSGRGKADSVVLHGRWFQVELHGGSSICGCRHCDGQHEKQHGGGRGSGVAIVHGMVLSWYGSSSSDTALRMQPVTIRRE